MHEKGYIHRNVKPENMALAPDNEVLLTGFSVAISPHGKSAKVAGTLPYMAPEQMQGEPLPASDQYALGVVVYEWLCGTQLFSGTSEEMLKQHLAVRQPSLRDKDPAIPLAVEQVVLKALAKDPQERFGSVQEFAHALEQAATVDPVGQQLGNYRINRLLGRGAFADIYLGEHILLKTQVAIKVLQASLGKDDLERFRNGAYILSNLQHPNIVQFIEFSQSPIPFLVMTLAPNGSLRQQHPRGSSLPLEIIINYVKQIASALQYIHDRGYIHRNVKSENILLGQNKEVLLGGFGIAIPIPTQDATVDMVGTIVYMAPEQIQGKPRPASDQYALAVMTYELLCGDQPFRGSLFEVYSQHLFTPPPSLREKVPTLPRDVEHVVMIGLNKDPHQRFASVLAFATAFEQASKG
jgi:serine/threonine protein kinase